MINPKFAQAVSVVLALIVIYVGYLLFGNTIKSAFQTLASSPPAVISTPVPNDIEIPSTFVPEGEPIDQLDEAPIVELPATEPPAAPTDTVVPQVEEPVPTDAPESPTELPTAVPKTVPTVVPTVVPTEVPAPTEAPVEVADNSRTVNGLSLIHI